MSEETASEVAEETPVDAGPPTSTMGESPEDDQLVKALSQLVEEIREHHARAEARERVIDQLHAEVERLRMGEQAVVLRPVITDVQNLRGDLLRQARTLPADITGQQVTELLESFALSAELALERCGIEPLRPKIGEPFSPREHRAIKVVETDSADLDGTVAAVLSDGYREIDGGRVTTPARVHVGRWTEPHESAPEAGELSETEGNTNV